MSCTQCGNDSLRSTKGHNARADEPEADAGYECMSCGHWQREEDEPVIITEED